MKNLIFLISLIFLTSCYEIHTSELKNTKGFLIDTVYTPSHSEYCYHYGYNMMNGKYEWHMGNDNKPESYNVRFTFLNTTMCYDSKEIYESITDTFTIAYVDSYRVKKNKKDSTFNGYRIKNLIIKDKTISIYQ